MEIKVDAEVLRQVVEAIKNLPVKGGFNAADRWVGIVMVLESMLEQASETEETLAEGE